MLFEIQFIIKTFQQSIDNANIIGLYIRDNNILEINIYINNIYL